VFGKKKKTNSDGANMGSERGLTLLKLSLPPIILVVLIVLVCGYVAYVQYAGLVKQAQQVQHVADAENMAARLGGRLVALGDQVAMQAKADAVLAVAIDENDSEALRHFEQGLSAYFPDAVRIRVVRPAETNPDNSVSPPIGYACLDLARQAEAGSERPPLEIHLHGSEHAHLDLVRPIMRNGKTIASLMVSFSADKIKVWLKEMSLEAGYVELQQGWEGPVLGRIGDAGAKHETPTHRAMISGSSWQLSYWTSDGIGMAEAQKLGFLATFGVAAAVIAAVMFLYALFLSATIKRELQSMVEFMLESGRGKRFHSYPVKLVEMEKALEMMEPVISWAKTDDGIKEKAEGGDEGISDMMFMDFGEITVEENGSDVLPQGDANKP
jgi:phosphomannomutase/phosphoglucomutase